MTLQELRRARKLSQVRVAKKLGIEQDDVSKIERRRPDDFRAPQNRRNDGREVCRSLLNSLMAPSGVLSGIADEDSEPKPTSRKHAHA